MITVSFTEFRDKLPKYLESLSKGKSVTVMNAKKGKKLVILVAKKEKEFDWDEHMEFVENIKPFWTKEDDEMLRKSRKASVERFKRLNW
jgi:PHD/YefM family antitoxin component YafN of YafNO toxin-antitoxin module